MGFRVVAIRGWRRWWGFKVKRPVYTFGKHHGFSTDDPRAKTLKAVYHEVGVTEQIESASLRFVPSLQGVRGIVNQRESPC